MRVTVSHFTHVITQSQNCQSSPSAEAAVADLLAGRAQKGNTVVSFSGRYMKQKVITGIAGNYIPS